MKILIVLISFSLSYTIGAQDETIIKEKLQNQAKCWNKGDINCFMEDYWQSAELLFIGKSGVTYGWENTLNNYKMRYPTKKEMGELKFEILELNRINKQHYFMVGKWNLTRDVGDISGHFSLLWKKINGDWVIIADHSSQEMKDLFGRALLDFYYGQFQGPLLLHNEYGDPEVIPIESYFRLEDNYTDLEVFALQNVKGKTLDIGAASGRHALYLQQRALDITAMDISPNCGELMNALGVKNIIIKDILDYTNNKFDTIFMLMNGVGIAGNLDGLEVLLKHLKSLVRQDGQILLDSSDISYLYEETQSLEQKYFGQLRFHYEYKGEEDDDFNWLYVDQNKLKAIAGKCGWNCQVIYEDETDAYLARLTHD